MVILSCYSCVVLPCHMTVPSCTMLCVMQLHQPLISLCRAQLAVHCANQENSRSPRSVRVQNSLPLSILYRAVQSAPNVQEIKSPSNVRHNISQLFTILQLEQPTASLARLYVVYYCVCLSFNRELSRLTQSPARVVEV